MNCEPVVLTLSREMKNLAEILGISQISTPSGSFSGHDILTPLITFTRKLADAEAQLDEAIAQCQNGGVEFSWDDFEIQRLCTTMIMLSNRIVEYEEQLVADDMKQSHAGCTHVFLNQETEQTD